MFYSQHIFQPYLISKKTLLSKARQDYYSFWKNHTQLRTHVLYPLKTEFKGVCCFQPVYPSIIKSSVQGFVK